MNLKKSSTGFKATFTELRPMNRRYLSSSSITCLFVVLIGIVCCGTLEVMANYPPEFVTQVREYPNIIRQKNRCLPNSGTYKHSQTYVCDPTRLLKVEEINRLNDLIVNIKDEINKDSGPCDSSRPRPVIGVALLNGMSIGPSKTPDRILGYASIFAYYLFDNWNLPSNCHLESDKLIIFYSKADGALYTFAGDLLKTRLPSKFIISTAVESQLSFENGIYGGIKFLLEKYREAVTPSQTVFRQP